MFDLDRHLGKIILLVVAAIFGGVYAADRHDCQVYSSTTGLETQYNWGTCYVKQGDRFYPRDELRIRNATHGE